MPEHDKGERYHRKNRRPMKLRLYNMKWVILITIWTFFLAIGMSYLSETIMKSVDVGLAFCILILIMLIGVLFDLIGIAVATARENPLHSMAANRIHGASFAVNLVRNAGPVSNFCNDVIGDICGIISGTAAAYIILKLQHSGAFNTVYISIVLSGFVAAFTVGGKAIGKEIALRNSKEIVFFVGKILYYLDHNFGINILPSRKQSLRKKRKRDGQNE